MDQLPKSSYLFTTLGAIESFLTVVAHNDKLRNVKGKLKSYACPAIGCNFKKKKQKGMPGNAQVP